jgi:hypothetical protein
MVFILLIFFIVATSFVNEVGISSSYKDSNSKSIPNLLYFLIYPARVRYDKWLFHWLRRSCPQSSQFFTNEAPSVIIQVSKGAKAGLATQVMDQALISRCQSGETLCRFANEENVCNRIGFLELNHRLKIIVQKKV